MPIKISVLKETRLEERRVALVPSVADKLVKLGAVLSVQSGAGDAANLPDAAFKNVVFVSDPRSLVGDADIVLAVQPPAPETVRAMKGGAILLSFVYANKEPALVDLLRQKNITSFAMERVPRISRAQAMDALSSQAALAGYYAALLGATHLARVFPRMTTAVGSLRPATVLVMGLGVAGCRRSRPRIDSAPSSKAMTFGPRPREKRLRSAQNSSIPASTPQAKAAMRAN